MKFAHKLNYINNETRKACVGANSLSVFAFDMYNKSQMNSGILGKTKRKPEKVGKYF